MSNVNSQLKEDIEEKDSEIASNLKEIEEVDVRLDKEIDENIEHRTANRKNMIEMATLLKDKFIVINESNKLKEELNKLKIRHTKCTIENVSKTEEIKKIQKSRKKIAYEAYKVFLSLSSPKIS